jgi:hypothetical protein
MINKIKDVITGLRRYFYILFRRKYINESIAKRKGKCQMCGCCAYKPISCKHFNKKTKVCDTFNNLPYECKIYPFDEKDKTEYSKKNCSFYWEPQK